MERLTLQSLQHAAAAPYQLAAVAAVRARIAGLMLGEPPRVAGLGAIRLRPHQEAAVARARAIIEEFGGVLVADDVGLGKTYIALALAAGARAPIVVAPAALRAMWNDASARCGLALPFISYESLSRGATPPESDLVIVDEAHHARTPTTRRYQRIAAMAGRATLVLLSATPVHNSRRDLCALLGLFLGAAAWTLGDEALTRCVVRRMHEDLAEQLILPETGNVRWLELPPDESLLDVILSVPPPVPPSDGGQAGVLVSWSLLRQWSSSHAALRGAIRRRLARAAALEAALTDGRHPSRSELAAWCFDGDAIQLAFPGIVASQSDDAEAMLPAVRAHAAGLRAVLEQLRHAPPLDEARVTRLREVRRSHRDEKVVAFSQFADTVRGIFRGMRGDAGLAMLTGSDGGVAGGELTRREVLGRFAPVASGCASPTVAERVDLLLTTDLLSEGVNLQDASVVVHLDLPWTPARLEQRVGRARRLGALHAEVAVYAMRPPAEPERIVRIEQRLAEKLRAAGGSIGISDVASHGVGLSVDMLTAPTRDRERIVAALQRWRAENLDAFLGGETVISAVEAAEPGALALLQSCSGGFLVAVRDGRATDALAAIVHAVDLAKGDETEPDPRALECAIDAITAWQVRRAADRAAGGSLCIAGEARRAAIRRIGEIAARAPRHRRMKVAHLAHEARRVVTARFGVGPERMLGELAMARMADEAWLSALIGFGAANARLAPPDDGEAVLRAVILLQPRPR